MKITILTLFPEMFTSYLSSSIIKRAIAKGIVSFELINIRDFTLDKHHRVDNPPVGGGAGLIMMCQPIYDALQSCKTESSKIYLTSPRGKTFNQQKALEMSKEEHLIFICGHYEGIDERINKYVDENISLGDFILTGGEVAVMTMADSITRLIQGVISDESIVEESFSSDTLEYPQYTKPREFRGMAVPEILLSGDHAKIDRWRLEEAVRVTRERRPDMLAEHPEIEEALAPKKKRKGK